jgi:hypothetical protein
MKVFVVHDQHGMISSMGTPAPEYSGSVGLAPAPGQSVSALEVDEIVHSHHFEKYLREYRVDLATGRPNLIKK